MSCNRQTTIDISLSSIANQVQKLVNFRAGQIAIELKNTLIISQKAIAFDLR